ncbi:MAG: hypothetical protein AAF656_11535 [Planctomycetota bacterium]
MPTEPAAGPHWNSGGAWAGRLAFPALVAGILLGMRAAEALRPAVEADRDATTGYLYLAGCMAAIGLGLWLLRARHRYLHKISRDAGL